MILSRRQIRWLMVLAAAVAVGAVAAICIGPVNYCPRVPRFMRLAECSRAPATAHATP